jgi:hypothetical protein
VYQLSEEEKVRYRSRGKVPSSRILSISRESIEQYPQINITSHKHTTQVAVDQKAAMDNGSRGKPRNIRAGYLEHHNKPPSRSAIAKKKAQDMKRRRKSQDKQIGILERRKL